MHPKVLLDTCADLIAQTLTFQHPADATVARFFREHRQLGPRERHTLSDTVYAVLREKPRLQWWAKRAPAPADASAAPKPPKGTKPSPRPPHSARCLALLVWRDQQPDLLSAVATEAELTWLATCTAATWQAPDAPPDVRHLLPYWLAQPLQAQLGDGFAALAAAVNEPAPLDVRINPLKTKRPAALQQLQQVGLEVQPTPYSPWGIRLQGKPSLARLPLFAEGALEVQDEGSQLLALLLDAKRNELVVDFCAGAGGKTLAIGAAMRNTGRLYAIDTSAHRLEGLQPRLQRAGLTNVHPMVIAHERDERLNRMLAKADRVLVDAPCSGLGTLRRSPDVKWRQTPQQVEELAALQGRILASAARLVKTGGRLVYATCSLLEQENEAVAQAFAQTHRDFEAVPVSELLQQVGLESEAVASLCQGDYLRLWPHLHGTDGFFAAVWRRKF